MYERKIANAFDEPGCATNRAKSDKARKQGCSAKALTPGAAAGGCAFDGAKIALQPITDAAHLVHGPIACEGNSWDSRNTGSSGPSLYRAGFTTDLSELDIIHGGEKKLYRAIKEIVQRHRPPAVFVYVTCVTALTGDDVEAVCKAATERLGTPIIPVSAPGFAGSKNLGNKLAGHALLDHVIGTIEPEETTPTDINVLGEYNVAGELWQVAPLFARLGIRVLAPITGDARYRQVAGAHRARINMVVCSQAMVSLARAMQERWDIPFFEGSFYGIGDTSSSLRVLARMLVERGAEAGLIERTETLIADEEARAWAILAPYRERLQGKRVLLYTGGVKSWSVVSALQETGMTVIGTSVRKSTAEDKERIKGLMGDDAPMVDQIPAKQMYVMLARGDADILMSGGRTQFVALKTKTPWLDINQERHHGYAGYDGTIALIRQIDAELSNPIWAQVRAPAPWDSGAVAPHPSPSPARGRGRGDGSCPLSCTRGRGRGPRQREGEGHAVTDVISSGKAASMNPLKQSPALGGAMAFLGIERTLPLLHGSQGCTAFALVLMVRHFREAIPLQTTAMSELTTILGGAENVEAAIENIVQRAKPRLIGICSTALTETRGEDIAADLRSMRERHPEWNGVLDVVSASTPDYGGSLEEGWGKAVTAIIETLVPQASPARSLRRVNLLAGSHLTPGDVEELGDLIDGMGLEAIILPDLSRSLDGHVPDGHVATSLGGTRLDQIAAMGASVMTLAIGEQMRGAAEALRRRTGVAYRLFDHVTGLAATDAFVAALMEAGGEPGARLKHERSRLVDAMLDGHFSFDGKRVGVAAEPDLLLTMTDFIADMGGIVQAAVSPVPAPSLARAKAPRVIVGDLDDLEQAAAGCDLLISNSHAREAAERLGVPLYRAGFPVFDRLGGPQRISVGYRGTRRLVFDIANVFLERAAGSHHTHTGAHPEATSVIGSEAEHSTAGRMAVAVDGFVAASAPRHDDTCKQPLEREHAHAQAPAD